MSGQILRWALAFVATSALAGSVLFSAIRAQPAADQTVPRRDPAAVSDLELDLILNKIREGDLLSEKGDLSGAKRAWAEGRRLGEGLWPIHEGLGDSYVRAKLYEAALGEYDLARGLVPEAQARMRLEILAKRAGTLALADRPLEAITSYLELGRPELVGDRILALAPKAGATKVAQIVADRARTSDPRYFLLLSRIESLLGHSLSSAEALAEYTRAVAPWEESLNRQAVEGLRAGGKVDRAIEVCQAWSRAAPQAVDAYVLMGDLYRQSGREKEAIIAYSSIVGLRPGEGTAHRRLGDLLRGMNRPDEALVQYEAAKKASPQDSETYDALLTLFEARGDSARTEAILKEAAERFGASAPFRSRLRAFYEGELSKRKAAGKPDEARAVRRKLGALNVVETGLFDLKVLMTWDVESDVDLDVFEPGGEHVVHGHPDSKAGGHYYVDNVKGFGPETYTLPNAPTGTYRIGAHLHGDKRSTVKFVVILYEDTPREERREETLVVDKAAEVKYIRDVVISK